MSNNSNSGNNSKHASKHDRHKTHCHSSGHSSHRHRRSSSGSRSYYSHSVSRSRSRSRSHSRDSSSINHPPLSVPDPLVLEYKPISSSVITDLKLGNKFISLNTLIRKKVLHSHHSEKNNEKRLVENSLDFFEVLFSSLLPSMVQQIIQLSSSDIDNNNNNNNNNHINIHNIIPNNSSMNSINEISTKLQQYICFSLHSIILFKTFDFQTVFNYLEAHRRASIERKQNISEPDSRMINEMYNKLHTN